MLGGEQSVTATKERFRVEYSGGYNLTRSNRGLHRHDVHQVERRVPPSSRGAKRGQLVGGLEEGDSLDVRVNDVVAGYWIWPPEAGVKAQVYCVEAVPGDCTDIPRLVLRSVPRGWLGNSPNARAL